MRILLVSALAGICGTGLGGMVTSAIGTRSQKVSGGLLAFAGGVMLSVVCFGLVPEAHELSGMSITVLGLVIGMIVIALLNRLVDSVTEARMENKKATHTHTGSTDRACLLCQSKDVRSMLRSGILMLVAIGLHNIPEGIAIGAGGSHDEQLGILLTAMIALHNIPEGMAIAAPLLSGGMNKGKVILLSALSGAPTLIGGILGALLGYISNTAIALSLSAAGGAMLYVVFSELIPQSLAMTKGRAATVVSLAGVILGLAISL